MNNNNPLPSLTTQNKPRAYPRALILLLLTIVILTAPSIPASAYPFKFTLQQEQQEQTKSQPADNPAQQNAEPNPEDEPNLDELLGLSENNSDQNKSPEPAPTDLDKSLNPEDQPAAPPIAKLFLDAIQAMNASADRLNDQHDPGLVTQRLQEDALLKLATLIKQAQKQGNKSKQGGKQQSQKKKKNPDNQKKQSNTGQAKPGDQAAVKDSRPARREVELKGNISENRSEWGNLPARIRDLLLQGSNESSALLYKHLTELYYKKLAEESKKQKQ